MMNSFYKGELPQLLCAEEEKAWVNELYGESPQKAREMLILHNLRLVAIIAERYPSGQEAEDLMSSGIIGLVKAVDTYRPSQNSRITTYASKCIENEIRMYLRSANRIRDFEVSTVFSECIAAEKDPEQYKAENYFLFSTSHEDPVGDTAVNRVAGEELKKAVSKLSPSEKYLVKQRYGGTTQAEAAREIGMSQSCLARKEKRIIKKLRRYML